MTPMLISGGKAYPISAAQFDRARRCEPIGSVAGLTPVRTAGPAATALASSAVPRAKPDTRATSRASMLAEIGRKYGADARAAVEAKTPRFQGLDPKAATIGQPQPKAGTSNGRAVSRASMLQEIQRSGGAVR